MNTAAYSKPANQSPYRAIIFDCFGVLYVGALQLLADHCETPEQQTELDDLIHAFDRGFIPTQEFYQAVADVAAITPEQAQQFMTRPQQPNHVVFDWAQALKQAGYTLAVLSNMGQQSSQQVFSQQDKELFAGIFVSGQTGHAKPHPSSYHHAAQSLGVDISQCIMIDDNADNVAGAMAAGMAAVQFKDIADCQRQVAELLNA